MYARRTMRLLLLGIASVGLFLAVGCTRGGGAPELAATGDAVQPYRIGPGDMLRIFVWGNPGLSETVPVRPDGRVSIPLVEDLDVVDKTPTEAGRLIEGRLGAFIEDPLVTVIVTEFVGPFTQQVRVVGEAAEPKALPYRANMTVLDVMIEVGGLTEFAAGNRSTLIRKEAGADQQYRVRLGDLIRDGDITANVQMQPGDVLIIPESFF